MVITVLVGTLYAPVFIGLVHDWYKDPDYSHGPFVPLLSGYILYRKRGKLAAAPVHPTWLGLIVILGSLGLLFLGNLAAEYFISRISLLGTIVGIILYVRGGKQLQSLAFPLAFLLLMIPLPTIVYDQIIFPMQLVTSRLVTGTLENVQLFPIMREGNLLITGRYSVEVVQACSGVRSLMTLLALALGYGYLMEGRPAIRIMLACSVFPLAIFGNALRVCSQVMLAYYLGASVTEGLWHSLLGLIGFSSAAGLLPVVHEILRRGIHTKRGLRLGVSI